MPLSEHEQRLLEQMERALNADDPKLASTLRGSGRGLHDRRRLVLGGLGLLAGVALLIGGVSVQVWALGVLGFLVMLGSAWLASSGWGAGAMSASASASTGRVPPSTRPAAPSKGRGGFMRRIEERWDRRRDEGDR